ncbi:MAG: inorganic phosphate transporter [Planctomycetaceae bacterium]
MPDFLTTAVLIGLGMLILDCVEVGRNDAANLVNAGFGAGLMDRRKAAMLAGIAVILGATFSAPVIETARKGIFDPSVLTIQMAVTIYVSVYFVDTVLLYSFSGFGMPVSTTACLVFELVGASLFLAGPSNVNWPNVGSVAASIVISILFSGMAAFMMMRVFRGAMGNHVDDRERILLHGPWIAGAILTWLTWFMVFKGLKNVEQVQSIKAAFFDQYGEWSALLLMWSIFTLAIHLLLVFTHKLLCRHLFGLTAIAGMICMAFAFGQNDLANAASPGLSALTLFHGGEAQPDGLASIATKIPIPVYALFGCGVLMASGMFTNYAQRVTRAEVNTGSQSDDVKLYSPQWCQRVARFVLRVRRKHPSQTSLPEIPTSETHAHYDTLRASVITGISASVIALASGRGLPVSTTYVAFAAVIGTGMSDRVFARGQADTKLGRAIWVVSCWILTPIIAIVATGLIAQLIHHFSTAGLFLGLALSISVRLLFKHRADEHEKNYEPAEDDPHLSTL